MFPGNSGLVRSCTGDAVRMDLAAVSFASSSLPDLPAQGILSLLWTNWKRCRERWQAGAVEAEECNKRDTHRRNRRRNGKNGSGKAEAREGLQSRKMTGNPSPAPEF